MTKILMTAVPAMLLLSACGGAEAPAGEEAISTEPEFDEQLSEEEANAVLDELEAEEAEVAQ